MNLKKLKQLGFEGSRWVGKGQYQVVCYDCQAMTINGVPAHELECPAKVQECRGCNNLVPYFGYCQDCQ